MGLIFCPINFDRLRYCFLFKFIGLHLTSCGSVYFYKDSSSTLVFRKNIGDSVPLLRVYFYIYFSDIFRRGVWSFRWIWSQFTHKLLGTSIQYSHHYPLLSPGFLFSDNLYGGVSVGSCLSFSSLFSQGFYEVLRRNAPQMRAMS